MHFNFFRGIINKNNYGENIMAEKKSDFLTDPAKLKEAAEKLQKEIIDAYKFNSGDRRVVVKEDYTKKPVIECWDMPMGKINEVMIKGDWKFGTYYLQGEPKEGFYRMDENQQYVFIPIAYSVSALSQANYTNAFDLVHPIEALNPQLRGHVYPNESSIEIAYPILDNLEMPSPWKFDLETSCVVNTMTGYAVEIKVTNEANRDMSAPDVNEAYSQGSGILNSSTRDTVAKLRTEKDDEATKDDIEEQNDEIEITLEDLSPKAMFETYQKYTLAKVGGKYQLQNKEMHGAEHSMNLKTKDDAQTKKWAYLNNLWIAACAADNNGADVAADKEFMNGDNLILLGTIMGALSNGQPVSSIFMSIANDQRIDQKDGAVKVTYAFLQSLKQNAGLGIELNATVEEYLSAMSSMEGPSHDNDPVMEMKKPVQN